MSRLLPSWADLWRALYPDHPVEEVAAGVGGESLRETVREGQPRGSQRTLQEDICGQAP